jgi:adenosine deaminase
MKQPIVQWLEENKISRNDNLTNKFLDCIRFAELHLHIGGILSIESQIKVGEKIWSLISEDERKEALKLTKSIIDDIKLSNSEKSALKPNWNQLLREQKKSPRIRAACAASILVSFRADPLQLCYALFPSWDHRWENRLMMAGKRFGGCEGYAGYSTPGELMGSTMLCFDSDDVIKQYAWGIVREAEMQNLSYLEIRMSPTKYRPEILSQKEFVKDFVRYMNEVISIKNYDLDYRILISADRSFFNLPDEDMDYFFDDFRQLLTLLNSDTITRAVVAGYDIAGRENDDDIPGNIMKKFIDLNLDLGLSTTFHAGEQADSSNLRSAYSIHTNRVGHALRLIEHPQLLDAFVKSQICVEMCPTSNIEVHGYLTPDTEYYNFKGVYPEYPLRNYLEAGLPITICTDNTFISRTNMKNEIITASELLFDKPLTFFECMKIVYNGYKYSFTDFDIKKQLISKNGILMYDDISKIYEEYVSENNVRI